ncbi:MAG: FeoC-like transcriptional regulator [Deltaproteobacteria bacterium]|nr:FeoC-like transcriptional regulator [Deltaproteobacteria bacterium]
MILSGIKDYFKERSTASLSDLSIRFKVEPEAMRGMLDHWMRKGRVRRLDHTGSCTKCCSNCKSDHLEIYEWTGERSGQC